MKKGAKLFQIKQFLEVNKNTHKFKEKSKQILKFIIFYIITLYFCMWEASAHDPSTLFWNLLFLQQNAAPNFTHSHTNTLEIVYAQEEKCAKSGLSQSEKILPNKQRLLLIKFGSTK